MIVWKIHTYTTYVCIIYLHAFVNGWWTVLSHSNWGSMLADCWYHLWDARGGWASTEVLIPPPCFTCQKGCITRSEGKRDEAKRKDSGCHTTTQTDRIVCLLFNVCYLLFLFFFLMSLLFFFFVVSCFSSSSSFCAGACFWCWCRRWWQSWVVWLPLLFALLLVVVGHKRCQCAFRLKKKTYGVAVPSNCKWDSDRIVHNMFFRMSLI